MTASAAPTMTHGLTERERRAFTRAIHSNLAARVQRVAPRRYLVPSTSSSDVYAVWQDEAGTLHCPCVAGSLGHACTHKAAVLLRKTQEAALAQARKLAQAPAVTLPAAKHPYPSRRLVELV
jgi:hypothetical protein